MATKVTTVYPWRKTLRRWSTYVWAAFALLAPAWLAIPSEWQKAMMDKLGTAGLFAMSGLAFAGYIVTNIRQKNLGDEDGDNQGSPKS